MTPRAVFVGPMASGKTKIGKRIARILGVGFTDTDRVVVAEHGPIAEIFATFGEQVFRQYEREAVIGALRSDDVVSLGGGAVLDADTRSDLATQRVVLLTVTPEVVARRLDVDSGKRPLLPGGIADWERIYAERRARYEEVATVTFDTSNGDFDAITREVAAWLRT
jgi:shikimate kinase